jgi:hypothetical protein
MKSIETKWKGWRFRSRTEARWAVFLEAAGVHFEYEPEGVILPSGPYLPDFRMRGFSIPKEAEEQDVWLEVKGQDPTNEELKKCSELASASGCPVLLAIGAPNFMQQIILLDDDISTFEKEVGSSRGTDWRIFLSHFVGRLAFMNVGGPGDDTIVVARGPRQPSEETDDKAFDEMIQTFDGIYCRVLGMKDGRLPIGEAYIGLGKKLQRAYDAARSARFEFGETDKRWS